MKDRHRVGILLVLWVADLLLRSLLTAEERAALKALRTHISVYAQGWEQPENGGDDES